jgi:hypothetical protein
MQNGSKRRGLAAAATLAVAISSQLASAQVGPPAPVLPQDNVSPPRPTSDAQKAVVGAAVVAARTAAAQAVGGAAAKVIAVTPLGVGIGILLTPSEIACGEGEYCSKKK